jgi:hypothetical protein
MVEEQLNHPEKLLSMKRNFKYTALLFCLFAALYACKKNDYFKGGTIRSNKVEMSTYDFLKSQSSGLFDTLVLLIDRAGLKDKINQNGITFFVPTDYAINNYLARRRAQEQNIDPARLWTIDSLIKYELPKFSDSINAYIINQRLVYDNLTQNGNLFATQKTGAECVVSYEETFDTNLGYNPNVSTPPRIVYYTLLRQPITPPIIANQITTAQGVRARVQTSGIESTTGIIHVLNNGHRLFF